MIKKPQSPSWKEISSWMDKAEQEVLDDYRRPQADADDLNADPFSTAFSKVTEALKKATKLVMLHGKDKLIEAQHLVVDAWEAWREQLGVRAMDLVDAFEEFVWKLIKRSLDRATGTMPLKLTNTNEFELKSVTAELNWSISPSIYVATNRWLAASFSGGLKLAVCYSR